MCHFFIYFISASLLCRSWEPSSALQTCLGLAYYRISRVLQSDSWGLWWRPGKVMNVEPGMNHESKTYSDSDRHNVHTFTGQWHRKSWFGKNCYICWTDLWTTVEADFPLFNAESHGRDEVLVSPTPFTSTEFCQKSLGIWPGWPPQPVT